MAKAIAAGTAGAAVVLFAGYMCGAPIVLRSPENFLSYYFALIFGVATVVIVSALTREH